MKKILIKIRTSMKFFILVSIATFIIVALVAFLYKPIYSVTLNGEKIGYSADKSKLQSRIDDYIENGDGENSYVAFVQVDNMPTYNQMMMKYLKKLQKQALHITNIMLFQKIMKKKYM